MGYNLWLARESDIYDYYYRRSGGKEVFGQMMLGEDPLVYPLTLTIDGVVTDDFTLDEIDSFVCKFKDLNALKKELSKYPDYKEIALRPGELIIARKTNNINKYKVIYNNPLLANCSMVIRDKRRRGEKEFLDRSPEIEAYVKKILKYVMGDRTTYSITGSPLVPPHVQKVLRIYREHVKSRRFDSANSCFENLYNFCLNYKTLRGFIVWEQDHLEKVREQRAMKARATRSLNEEKNAVYDAMRYEEELRHRPYESPVLEEIDGFRDSDGNIDFDQVYSRFDLDDIHTHSKEGLQSIGILPIDSVPKDDSKGARKK